MLAEIKNGVLLLDPTDNTSRYALDVFKVAFLNGSGSIGIKKDNDNVDIIVTAEKKTNK